MLRVVGSHNQCKKTWDCWLRHLDLEYYWRMSKESDSGSKKADSLLGMKLFPVLGPLVTQTKPYSPTGSIKASAISP